jgi:geranylgeranyl diphosphate synthase type I
MEPSREIQRPFRLFAEDVKAHVDRKAAQWLEARIARADRCHEEVGAHAQAIAGLAVRGGKRLRPVLAAAAYRAFGGGGATLEPITPALVALELLQTYLLVHDDWMDGDELRRGGPTVHAALAMRFGSSQAGAVAAILAGDLASAYATESLAEANVAAPALVEAFRELAEMHHRVVLGQTMDVRGVCRSSDDVERMHDLKTGSYTVRGPLRLGAALAGADTSARAALDGFATPVGIAFQLRDDLLGIFGNPAVTGKPRGSDLREGKRTAVTAALATDAAFARRFEAAKSCSSAELEELVKAIEATDVRARVEARIDVLAHSSARALEDLPVNDSGRELLRGAVDVLARRDL